MTMPDTAGEYVCSDCRCAWVHDGGPLAFTPVVDDLCRATPRRWHPCPDCGGTVFGDLAHRLRQRTMADLRAVAEVA